METTYVFKYLQIYLSRALSGWGDRLWAFGAGIFMNLLAPQNLRLVAIYGFATSVSVIIFGAMIGSWIDKTTRLKVRFDFSPMTWMLVGGIHLVKEYKKMYHIERAGIINDLDIVVITRLATFQ